MSASARASARVRACARARIVCARSKERIGEGARGGEGEGEDAWDGKELPCADPFIAPMQSSRVEHAAAHARSRSPTSNWTWIPGCIWDISCSHELPDRGSLMTMYAVGL